MNTLSQTPPIYVISGGVGASGEQVVHTVLAQFPGSDVPVITVANVRQESQVETLIQQAKQNGAAIVHTLVERHLHDYLISRAQELQIPAFDLMGDLLSWIATATGHQPAEKPGLYRRLHQDYFERVSAIEYTMAHDDGKHPQGWQQADMLLVGVSRAGKTPLSLYLSVLGWKVANVPFVTGINLSPEILKLDPRRVIGLTIDPGQLLIHRQKRQIRLGAPGHTEYTDPVAIQDEIDAALMFCRQHDFSVINVTDKSIETSADEIIRLMARRFESL